MWKIIFVSFWYFFLLLLWYYFLFLDNGFSLITTELSIENCVKIIFFQYCIFSKTHHKFHLHVVNVCAWISIIDTSDIVAVIKFTSRCCQAVLLWAYFCWHFLYRFQFRAKVKKLLIKLSEKQVDKLISFYCKIPLPQTVSRLAKRDGGSINTASDWGSAFEIVKAAGNVMSGADSQTISDVVETLPFSFIKSMVCCSRNLYVCMLSVVCIISVSVVCLMYSMNIMRVY